MLAMSRPQEFLWRLDDRNAEKSQWRVNGRFWPGSDRQHTWVFNAENPAGAVGLAGRSRARAVAQLGRPRPV